jgi:capsular polysaccharide biosynthesis protein
VAASLLVAAVVYAESALQPPTYEATAVLSVGPKEPSDGKIHLIPNALPPERLRALAQMTARAVETRPVAEGAIRRLGLGASLSPGELLDNLTVEQVESSEFLRLTYTDTDQERAPAVVNAVGRESSERFSVGNGTYDMTTTLYDKASWRAAPVSPKPGRNGLIAFVAGLAISSATLFAVRRGWLRLVWPG